MHEKCILHVEDEEGDVFLLNYAFERAGVTCLTKTVADGQMAIDYLDGRERFADRSQYPIPCLVLLDLKLPKTDGFEVLEWIRRQSDLKNLVVVLFSSSALPADIERAYALGANSYISKPSSLAGMIEIAQLLKGWWLAHNHFPPLLTHSSVRPELQQGLRAGPVGAVE